MAWLVIWLYQLQLARVGVPLALFGVVHAAMGLGQIALLSRVAWVERDRLYFRGLVLRPDGRETYEAVRVGTRAEAAALGTDAGRELKRRMPANFFTGG